MILCDSDSKGLVNDYAGDISGYWVVLGLSDEWWIF